MVKVYIVRHCPTKGNAVRVFQGSIDTDLSEKGYEQRDLLAVRFRNIKLDAVYASPQGRAQKTAEGVSMFNGAPIITVDYLHEIGVGEADGRPWFSIGDDFPEFAKNWDNAPWDAVSPGGETMRQVYERMKNAFLKIAGESEGKTIAIVSHGCALHNLMCYLLHDDITKLKETDFLNHSSVSLLNYDDGKAVFEYYNDISHIKDAVPVKRPLFYN